MTATIWCDVEDLFHYARTRSRPSGIQRASFEMYRALCRCDHGHGRIRFLRHSDDEQGFVVVAWPEVEALFANIAHDKTGPAAPSAQPTPVPAASPTPVAKPAPEPGRPLVMPFVRRRARWQTAMRHKLRCAVRRLPDELRRPLVLFLALQAQCALALLQLLAAIPVAIGAAAFTSVRAAIMSRVTARSSARRRVDRNTAVLPRLETLAQPGDVLLVLGSPWFHETYGDALRRVRNRLKLRCAAMVYDIIPLRRPEWCDYGTVRAFRDWQTDVLPLCDIVFTGSRATADDLRNHAASVGIRLSGPPVWIPLGTGFGDSAAAPAAEPAESFPDLPEPGSYVLLVSTIEARKNHALMVAVWRRLLETLPAPEVPTLVFAGGVGWLVADLMQQLDNADWFGGRIRFIRHPSDAALRALYEGCLFTVFPSFYEGWGLPVGESLAFGKPCLAARATSLPEVGGSLARYFDPEDLEDAIRAVSAVIQDRAALAAWQAQVVREFRPTPWEAAATAILHALDGQPAAEAALRRPVVAALCDAVGAQSAERHAS